MGHAASRFRPKLHNRAESFSLESLDMTRAVDLDSLDIEKFGRESQDLKSQKSEPRRLLLRLESRDVLWQKLRHIHLDCKGR